MQSGFVTALWLRRIVVISWELIPWLDWPRYIVRACRLATEYSIQFGNGFEVTTLCIGRFVEQACFLILF